MRDMRKKKNATHKSAWKTRLLFSRAFARGSIKLKIKKWLRPRVGLDLKEG